MDCICGKLPRLPELIEAYEAAGALIIPNFMLAAFCDALDSVSES
jgi:hypothetical protein